MKRPLAVIGFLMFAASLIAGTVSLKTAVIVSGCFFLLFLLALLFRSMRCRPPVLAALLCVATAFCFTAAKEYLVFRPLESVDSSAVMLKVQVCDLPTYEGSISTCTVKVLAGDLPKDTKITVFYRNPEQLLQANDVLTGKFALDLNKAKKQYARARGVMVTSFVGDDVSVSKPERLGISQRILFLRASLRDTITRYATGDDAAMIRAICFGDRAGLTDEINNSFRRAGVSHVVAVSGLHTAIISAAVCGLLRFFGFGKRIAAFLAALTVLLFMAINGFALSVSRAGCMCLILLIGQMAKREADALNSLGAALVAFVIINPFSVWDVGLQLSVMSTAGLIVLQPWCKRRLITPLSQKLQNHRVWQAGAVRLAQAFCVTASATLPIIPILVINFRELSAVTPFANLLAVPLSTPLVIVGCASTVSALLFPPNFIVKTLFAVTSGLSHLLIAVTRWFASLPLTTIPFRALFLQLWICGAIVLLVCGWKLLRGKGVRLASALSVIILCCGLLVHQFTMRGVVSMTVANVPDGSAILLQQEGYAALILDAAEKKTVKSAVSLLANHGVQSLDFLLITDLEQKGNQYLPLLFDEASVQTVISPENGEYYPTLQAVSTEKQRISYTNRVLSFWEDGSIESRSGWVRISCGDTRLLISPAEGNVMDLPSDWRQTHLTVFSGVSPRNPQLITAQAGVISGFGEATPADMTMLRLCGYPVNSTAMEGEMTFSTRRRGDLTILH